MFTIQTLKSFKVGDTYDCRINAEPAKITWKDTDTLVIEPGDPRVILRTRIEGDLRVFLCGHAGATKAQYVVDGINIRIRSDQINAVITKALEEKANQS